MRLLNALCFSTLGFIAPLLCSCAQEEPHGCMTTALVSAQGKVVIDGRYRQYNTGVEVRTGESLAITAYGQLCYREGQSGCYGPELVDDEHQGLWGQIGESGTPFYLGARFEGSAQSAGRVYLIIPEGADVYSCDKATYADNHGALTVIVSAGR
jgi:hypothetical protein